MTDLTNTTELVQRGKAAARVGRLDEAREMLGRAVQLAPDNVEAWLNLAAVEPDPVKKMACFEAILELDPENVEARLGLEMLQADAAPDKKPVSITDDDLEAVIAQASRQLEKAVGPPPPGEVPPDEEVLYCANHPNVQTRLRCNRCGKPICTRCAIRTPVGYRCRECVGQQQAVYFTGGALDYVIGGVIALVLSGLTSFLMTSLGAWFFALILGPTIGIAIAEAVRFAVRRRRSRLLWMVVGLCIILGAVPALLLALTSVWRLLTLGLFLLLAVGAATARLR
jgi:tetratricopeptide (TPR) repeat protein